MADTAPKGYERRQSFSSRNKTRDAGAHSLTEYKKIRPYVTKDGSLIRELMHPDAHGNRNQSLAEATVPPGSSTLLHKHHSSEELYHITSGNGLVILGNERLEVTVGDTICIPPGVPHRIQNTGKCSLQLLCCCSPAYAHSDTALLA